MITEPLTCDDHVEIAGLVRSFASATFSSERVRAAASSATGYDDVAWKQMVELGWTMAADQDDDLGPVVQCVVHRELGARLAPSPYLASVGFAATAVRLLGDTDAGRNLRDSIGEGVVTCTLVLGGRAGWSAGSVSSLDARQVDGAWTLDGEAELVLDAARADVLVVLARTGEDEWGLFQVDANSAGLERGAVTTVDRTRSFGRLCLSGVEGLPLHAQAVTVAQVDALVDRLAVFLSAEMVGAANSCMQQTLDYLRTRHQFGKPIGSFQALKHRCADTAVSLTIAHELLFAAAQMMAAGDAGALRVVSPLLLAQAGEVFKHTAEEAIQLHGGVGFTEELDIGLYYKRALVDIELLAAPVDAYARLDSVRSGETA
jgi:alkylation response protein AidB-like acyl-CoA dehydrogenase